MRRSFNSRPTVSHNVLKPQQPNKDAFSSRLNDNVSLLQITVSDLPLLL